MPTNFQKVIDFNRCFGHFISDTEYQNVFAEKPALVNLKYSLINEEVNELIEAEQNNDFVEIIDALSDIKYVLYGLACAFGINIDTLFKKNIRDKLETLEQLDSFNNLQTNYQLVKTLRSFWFKTDKVKTIITKDSLKLYKHVLEPTLTKIKQCNEELKQEIDNHSIDGVAQSLCSLLFSVNTFGILIDIDLDASFDIVHKSNMTKICETEELAKETVEWYKNNDSRYKTPDYFKNEYGYVIQNKDTGKVLKSIKYTPADFSSLLD